MSRRCDTLIHAQSRFCIHTDKLNSIKCPIIHDTSNLEHFKLPNGVNLMNVKSTEQFGICSISEMFLLKYQIGIYVENHKHNDYEYIGANGNVVWFSQVEKVRQITQKSYTSSMWFAFKSRFIWLNVNCTVAVSICNIIEISFELLLWFDHVEFFRWILHFDVHVWVFFPRLLNVCFMVSMCMKKLEHLLIHKTKHIYLIGINR